MKAKHEEWISWVQVAVSIPCLVVFLFLDTQGRIWLLGVVTMVTWTGTALASVFAARAHRSSENS